jgi:ribosomal protein RSM22 (predicted rRNA methylase)
MIPPSLPPALRAALDRKAQGLSRSDAAARATAISQAYRGGGNSGAIRDASDALAYALVRMPATYAAIIASLNALCAAQPAFAPATLLDIGAGPGTATWAAAEAFPSLAQFSAIDGNPALRALARDLVQGDARLSDVRYTLNDATAGLHDAPASDLVVASYVIGELDANRRAALTEQMWAQTRDTLLVVEPGTPDGSARIIALRKRLIARGAHVLAPCPHDGTCPLTLPDWCHFVQRLPRLRAHKRLKGAELPYEDEKFSYVALSRSPARRHPARVLAQPLVTKVAVTAKLCTPQGLTLATIPRRDKTAFVRARKLDWGDAVIDSRGPQAE